MNPWAKGTEAQPSSCQPSGRISCSSLGAETEEEQKNRHKRQSDCLLFGLFWRSQ